MIQLLFMGRKAAGAAALSWCLEQENIEVVGVVTDSHLEGSPTQDVAEQAGLRVLDYQQVIAEIGSGHLSFDLGVSFVYWVILKEPLISHPARGVINFHPAPLPDLKGTGGYNVAILQRRTNYGVSAHYVDEGIDTGEIIEVAEFAIDPSMATAQSLEKESMTQLLELFKRTVASAIQSSTRLDAKPNSGGLYISRSEMEAMKQIAPGDDPERKARAFWFPPYSGAQVSVAGRTMTVVPDSVLASLAEGETFLPR